MESGAKHGHKNSDRDFGIIKREVRLERLR